MRNRLESRASRLTHKLPRMPRRPKHDNQIAAFLPCVQVLRRQIECDTIEGPTFCVCVYMCDEQRCVRSLATLRQAGSRPPKSVTSQRLEPKALNFAEIPPLRARFPLFAPAAAAHPIAATRQVAAHVAAPRDRAERAAASCGPAPRRFHRRPPPAADLLESAAALSPPVAADASIEAAARKSVAQMLPSSERDVLSTSENTNTTGVLGVSL